ncbi:MAG: hypothetical protein HWD82_08325 [Flavobacteriaceae bacterium]|nr:hypothetical protein [Flavobacteriaceae bacterium]
MNFLKSNKKIVIITSIFIVLFITNSVVNTVISSKIEEKISDFLKDSDKEFEIKYEDISYSFLNSKITFEEIEMNFNDGEYIQIEELELTVDRNDLPSMKEIKEGNFNILLTNSEINLTKIKFVNRDVLSEVEYLELSLNGQINPNENELNFNYFDIRLNELEISPNKDEGKLELGNLEFELDSDDLINIVKFNELYGEIDDLSDLSIKFNLDNFILPHDLTKQLDLDDIGIRELEGKEFSMEITKNDDDLNLDFDLNTQYLGELSLEAEMDFSKNKNDPFLNLEVSLKNLDENFTKILKRTKLVEDGENSFRLNYEGNINDIEKSIF